MALKYRVSSLDGIPEAQQALYVEDGDEFRLDVEGVPDGSTDVARLNKALSAERATVRELRGALKSFEVDGKPLDVETYRSTLAEIEALRKSGGSESSAEMRKLNQQLAEVTKRLDASEKEREQARQKLRTTAIERALDAAADKLGIQQQYRDDVRRRATEFTLLDDDQTVVRLGADGQPGDEDPEQFLAGVVKEKTGWLKPSGGGGARGGGGAQRGVISRDDPAAFLANLDSIAAGKVQVQ